MYEAQEFSGYGRGGRGRGGRGRGAGRHGGFGPGGFGPGHEPGFGPGGWGPGGHGGPGAGFGPGGGLGRGRGGRGRGRARRGQIRAAVLALLAEEPMHGYQLMRAIGERTDGAWEPSPGAIYPTIAQLEDEGLVTVEVEGGRKLATLTDEGRVAAKAAADHDPFAAMGPRGAHRGLRAAAVEAGEAARTVARSGSDAQIQAATEILTEARRRLYLLLAEADAAGAGETPDEAPGQSAD